MHAHRGAETLKRAAARGQPRGQIKQKKDIASAHSPYPLVGTGASKPLLPPFLSGNRPQERPHHRVVDHAFMGTGASSGLSFPRSCQANARRNGHTIVWSVVVGCVFAAAVGLTA